MNKKFLLKTGLLLGITCFKFPLYAQEEEKALASIVYDFVHITDTNQRQHPKKETMILYMGTDRSVFKSQTLALKLEEMKKEMDGNLPDGKMGKNRISFNAPNISNEELFLFPQEKKIITVDKIGMTDYLIPEDFPTINWEITDETKVIGGYTCQSAKGSFGGRKYTVWFTTELPFPYGPWKLRGLPGLILQASDSKNEVLFNYAGFDKIDNTELTIVLPKDAITANRRDFEKAKAVQEKNFMSNWKNTLPANSKAKIVLKDQSGRELSEDEMRAAMERRAKDKKNQLNNPLELDQKQ
ncbi:GLPGLI family protein [Olivibacter domesticus]|uniref:GLPGLI family protein n=1 Tax=Olivibacter domesticus TaxID=407022 RepID=A0A1H7M378_OLID1|nr:GLPGLI family protein [Olivibacter domesticus]SEL05448.1 GLPGLI family protein [Olivibacter domesticus]